MSRDPDSRPPRKSRRGATLDDTLDELGERERAAAAVIERDVRDAAATVAACAVATDPARLSIPRARTPADQALAAAVAEIRRSMPEWQLAEQVAVALEALSAQVDAEARTRAAAIAEAQDQAAARAAEDAKRRSRWDPLWRWLKASGAAAAIAVGVTAVKALVDHGDSRRGSAQQAAMVIDHGKAIDRIDRIVTADHPIVLILAARLGMPVPAQAPTP